ncbi:isoleucine--tRNA ligase, partial [Porphyromonas endodontalis]|uniref:isoleucine--tRNA ligase n=1 Tax=Porphyromonas endodontalis TaxID=28124 RepID=UPI003C7C2B82
MKKKFREYTQPDFSGINKEILAKWEEENLFAESLRQRTDAPSFIFYEGPPSANGMPGIHHVIARSLKDIFCRYKTMKGYRVDRRAGWDTHGLPVELGVEKLLGITKDSIGKTISVAEYNATCRREVMKYTAEWEQLTKKMGYWVDMDHPYITYKNKYIETLWWLLADLHKKGFLYKGYTIQPYSPAAGTGLSTHELNQPGCYRDVKDTVCTAQFKVLNPKKEWSNWGDAYFLAWTTTPWTLPSNTALCVGPNIEYVAIETFNPYTSLKQTIIMGAPRVEAYFDPKNQVEELPEVAPKEVKKLPWRIVGHYKGNELAELQYEQLIPWVKPDEGAFRVITGDFVTTEDGTGIVHIAPTFGADDRRVAQQNNIPSLVLIDRDGQERPMVDLKGRFYKIEHLSKEFVASRIDLPLYDVYAGRYVKNAYSPKSIDDKESLDIDICVMLKMENKAFRIEKHTHNYPHCWRTDKPILYYPLDSWFIRTTACREQMIALNNTINWKPESTGSGRFGKWLENLQDWNLSRSRFWGTPLNIWRSEDGTEERCIASVEELYQAIEESIAAGVMKSNPFKGFTPGDYSDENYEKIDLHRPVVDEIKLVSPSGKVMTREQDLIDVWFDSGAMPYAQVHYPFEHKEEIESGELFPADFIAEGIDQTRGWFFTLHAISTMVRGSVAFKNVLANGLVLDKNGNKMSKRLGNAVDPFATIEQYGSAPLRWYMLT